MSTCKILNRPGGLEITEKALSLCNFPIESSILDVGCGTGSTVKFLKEKYHYNLFGVDIILENNTGDGILFQADAAKLPFQALSMDGILMECSFSLMNKPNVVLTECHRILKNNGKLIISDMYARGEAMQFTGCLGRIETKEQIISMLDVNNFSVNYFEDFSNCLQDYWGQMIFDKGASAFYTEMNTNYETLKRVKCGYFLMIASKIIK